MRGFESHEVPRGIADQTTARLHSLRRPVSGASFICAERVSLAGVVHLPSIWDAGEGLKPRCNCPESLEGWCRHTLSLAALWMKRPWIFDHEESPPTTPIGSLEPCRRASVGLDRFESFVGLALEQGLSRLSLAAELEAISAQVLADGLDRMATRLRTCSRRCAALEAGTPGEATWEAVEHLLEALRSASIIRQLMARRRVVESVHDEWLGSILELASSMPIRHRRYLEVGRTRFARADASLLLKRYWVDLTSGEVVSDELPEEERMAVEEGAQVLRLRRGELHPGFVPRWLESLSGQEEPAGSTEVGEALDRFLRGTAAAVGAWKKRRSLEQAPEDWIGGVACLSLQLEAMGSIQLVDDRHGAPLMLGGSWPSPDELPQGVIGAFGRLVLTPRGPAFFPLSLLTGEQVLLAPAELPFPHPRLMQQGLLPPGEEQALVGLLEALLEGVQDQGRWRDLAVQLEQIFLPGAQASISPTGGAIEQALALWTQAREGLLARLLG
ncbi:MAG: hypothetical protein FJ125_09435 [Deltaproteobacteria bacterium]|nr:hypothetical protein [Deltaproteobacteria bacterium]